MPEMDGWPLRQGLRGRSSSGDLADSVRRRAMIRSPDLGRIPCTEGNHLLGGRLGAAKSTDSTYTSYRGNMSKLELKQDSSQKARTPIKVLIEEEMSKDYEQRRASPNVIAKLMGLDGLPIPRPVHTKCKKDSQAVAYLREHSPEDHPCRFGDYQQEFKDVYEVSETSNLHRHQKRSIKKVLPKLSRSKNDINFIRQKFQDAKRLAADVKFHNSKDFSDALDVLDSNKDVLLKFLQEPNSLFRKHLQDLQSVHCHPESRHITLLKPSKITRLVNCETQGASSRLIEIHSPRGKDVMDLFHKKKPDTCDYSVKDKSPFSSYRLEESEFEEKAEHCPLPTHIVVLKPTIEKIKTVDTFPRRAENFPSGKRRQKEYGTPHKQKLLSEIRYRQKPDNIVIPRQKSTCSQISKEVSKSVRNDTSNSSLSAMALGCDESDRSECLQQKNGKSTLLDDGSSTFNQYNDWSGSCISSSFRSTESSLSREARKHLSERWRISSRSQNTGFPGECSSTLGEMLALSDRETTGRACRKDFQPRLGCPSGINSGDGWKDVKSRKLRRSRSLPPLTTFPSNSRQTNRKGSFGDRDLIMLKDILNLSPITSPEVDAFYENTMPFHRGKESYRVPSVDFTMDDGSHVPEPDESYHWERLCGAGLQLSEPSTSGYHDAMALADDITLEPVVTVASEKEDVTSEYNMDDELPSTDLSGETSREVADDHNNMISKKFKLVEHPHAETLCNPITSEPESLNKLKSNAGEPESPISCKDSEQPSPISVLELLEERQEQSSPECFERVNADLQGLRLQLQLLKKESKDADVGVELSSDEGSVGDGAIFQTTRRLREIPADDDERDFSYLIDMLSNAGFHDSVIETFSAACSLPECPVVSDIFEKLEKVHDDPSSWLRSERRLLFDLINSILMEIILPHMDRHPWVKSRRIAIDQSQIVLADEVWQLLVKLRKELTDDPSKLLLDTSWLDVRDIIDVIGGDIEKVLGDDLLDEVVHEFLSDHDVGALLDARFIRY